MKAPLGAVPPAEGLILRGRPRRVAAWVGARAIASSRRARVFHQQPLLRVAPAGLLLVACPILTFEGGLFFIPALAVLLVAAWSSGHPAGRVLRKGAER